MAALLGVERGSAAAPRQPALVNASRRTPKKQGQKPELVCTDTLGRILWKGTSDARSQRALREAVE